MKIKLAVPAALVVGFGCGVLVNCNPGANSTDSKMSLTLKIIPGFDKPMPVVNKGDKIEWFDALGNHSYVDFDPFSPCDDHATHTHTCVIGVAGGMFPYSCDHCEDPTVPVGRSTAFRGHKHLVAGHEASGTADRPQVPLYCDPSSNNATVRTPVKGLTGQYFVWTPSGIGTVPKDWTITVPPNTCQEGETFGGGPDPYRCTISSPLTSDVDYKVVINDCTGTKTTTGKIVHR